MLDAFIGKFSKDQRKDLSEIHGVLWEEDDSVQNCRDCNSKFTVSLRKHHCRGCGGIYCENCSSPDVTLKANSQSVRACVFCQRGETPGENIVRLIQTAIERKGDKVSIFPPAQPLSILRGSLYGDDDSRSIRLDGKPSHNFGYFEIVNKSNEMAAFKVIQGGGDSMRELCRPAYFTVPPLDSIHAVFSCGELEILVLYNNPNRIPAVGSAVTVDTRSSGSTLRDISPCAAVQNFIDCAIYRVQSCRGKNVLLKYKGEDILQTRQGTSLSRVGGSLFSRIGGGDSKNSVLNFSTNVESVDFYFSSTSSDLTSK